MGYRKMGITYNTHCVNPVKPRVLAILDLGEDEFIKALRTGLFHAFETEANVYGKGLVEGMVCVEYVDPAKDGSFVVG